MAMTMLIRDQALEYELLEKRKAMGADRYDEVWDGVYVMSPMANNDHQAFVAELTKTIGVAVDWKGLGRTLAGVNVSDRRDGWKDNYRTIKWDNQMGRQSNGSGLFDIDANQLVFLNREAVTGCSHGCKPMERESHTAIKSRRDDMKSVRCCSTFAFARKRGFRNALGPGSMG
jgi:hypothetical protein